jgi:hypothetical protein
LISRAQENPATCKSGALIPTGGRFSSMKTNNSSTGETRRFLMSRVVKMLRDKRYNFGTTMDPRHKDGK